MREQVCIYMCPYARFQSAMFDKDTLIISYDKKRGEPRGSRARSADHRALGLGDCIECTLCGQVCPTGAMHRTTGHVVNHNPDICIGCSACAMSCPYQAVYINREHPHGFWREKVRSIKGGTATGDEVRERIKGRGIPYYNPARDKDKPGTGVRDKGVVEKCNFCEERLSRGLLPACVEACEEKALVFGDLEDPGSAVREILRSRYSIQRKPSLGTRPKVYYGI